MTLVQLECFLSKSYGEALFDFLEEDLTVSLDEENTETWRVRVIAKAGEAELARQKMMTFLRQQGLAALEVSSCVLPPTDWVKAVHQELHPLEIGVFYIYGSHSLDEVPSGMLPLQIDAATAFGSGHHESTEGCLKALTWLGQQTSFENPLDMGCGSGVLALAMARLWQCSVLACDNDPEAVCVTLQNAQINQLSSLIKAEERDGFFGLKDQSFDLITANILAGPLCSMAKDALRVLRPGGVLILSGLLNCQAEGVIEAYRSHGAKLMEQLFVDEWSTLVMRKTQNG